VSRVAQVFSVLFLKAPAQLSLRGRCYSVFDSALNKTRDAKWQFPQEIATLHNAGDVNK
jgi:hypothetical protein